ncbi:M23 family metallopeptidase [Bacteroidota bacterium]
MIKNKTRIIQKLKYCVIFSFIFVFIFLTACRQEKVEEEFKPRNAHSAYKNSLEQANLHETALGKDWITAAEKALVDPINIICPFEEVFYVDPSSAFAIGYAFKTIRGQRIEIDIQIESEDSTILFIDLFRINKDSGQKTKVASSKKDSSFLKFEPRRDNKYILRLQPELLRGGKFRLTIKNVHALSFPVAGKDDTAIWSWFDDPRDGGRIKHNGVDIFASRHTEILACTDGYIREVADTKIGGKNIWLYDATRMLNIYYAHLQTQEVTKNTKVKAGQVIGTMGNTGNAINTPPHLHFGLYHRIDGPIDPLNFLTRTDEEPDKVVSDINLLGQLVRPKNSTLAFKSSDGKFIQQQKTLHENSVMKVTGASGKLFRVELSDGSFTYVSYNDIIEIDKVLIGGN